MLLNFSFPYSSGAVFDFRALWRRERIAQWTVVVVFCGALLGLSGCASITVRNGPKVSARPPSAAPTRIYVTEFSIQQSGFRVNKAGAEVARVERETAALLSRQIVAGLNRNVASAELVKSGQKLPQGSWVLRGKFVRVNAGSATWRILVGLGAGGSKMETQALLSAVTSNQTGQPLLRFETTGGSGAQVGLISIPLGGPVALPMLAYQVGSTVYSGASKGVNDDTTRTAHMIVAAISEEMARRGFPLRGKPLEPKRNWASALSGH